ncbi:MAG: orotidine-5'-phosphate decarboxylase [Pirellulaceae bacterium]
MPQLHFADSLIEKIRERQTPLVVGIDPRSKQLPSVIRGDTSIESNPQRLAELFELFSHEIIDVVAPLVPAIKPQMAFFEELGPGGMQALANVIDHAVARDLMVILDGKRNDIGSTGEAYARAYLGRKPLSPWGADALTINPWMGYDTVKPFSDLAEQRGAGVFVLVKTSNPGSSALQEQVCSEGPLYEQVATEVERISKETAGVSGYGIAGAVVGATYPEQMNNLRTRMPHTLFLVPGFGAQGGSASDVAGAFDENGFGAVINSSRGIIFAYEHERFAPPSPDQWQRSIEMATREAIEQIAADTPAGKLRRS